MSNLGSGFEQEEDVISLRHLSDTLEHRDWLILSGIVKVLLRSPSFDPHTLENSLDSIIFLITL